MHSASVSTVHLLVRNIVRILHVLAYINLGPTTLMLPEGRRSHPLKMLFEFTQQHLLILYLIIQGACIRGRSVYSVKTAGGGGLKCTV